MKTQKYNSLMSFVLILCFLFQVVSCDEETSGYGMADQLFRPINIKTEIDDVIGSKVSFSWVPIKGTSYYYLEISRDSFLFERDLQKFSVYNDDKLEIENLWSNSRYSARIKAVSSNNTIKDSEFKQITFVTLTENVFSFVAVTDISANSVLLKWDKSKNVSHIIISAIGNADVNVTLSASDISAGQKLIEGLKAGTSYSFKIYLGEMLRGTVTIKTK